MKRVILLMALLLLPFPAKAAGPILVDTDSTGEAVLWKDGTIHINLESGAGATLGQLSSDDAIQLVRDFFQDWQEVTIGGVRTVNITLDEGESLGSVTVDNMDDHFTYCPSDESCPTEDSPFVVGSARSGDSPILFDDDGSMTDAVQGAGASQSILGFAGPRVVERTGGVLYITEGQAIMNGRFINGVDSASDPEVAIDEFSGAIFHEIGHFIGLDHTQVNLSSVVKYLNGDTSEKSAIPTMLPLFVDGLEQLSPHFDDIVAISSLYPSADFAATTCRLEGTAFQSDGTTELQGVNAIASNQNDPLLEATSYVSGSLYTGYTGNCDAEAGDFTIYGLRPGQFYVLNIEPISQAFTGGSSVEPCDPPQEDFDRATIPGLFSCASAAEAITSGTEATTEVVTTKASTDSTSGSDGGDETTSRGSLGGCSLVP